MAKILITLPFSGRGVGGGLATFNMDLTRGLVEAHHDVRLLVIKLAKKWDAEATAHGFEPEGGDGKPTGIIRIGYDHDFGDVDLKADDGAARDELYTIMLDKIEAANTATDLGMPAAVDWTPDIIIGHSRFSGPAAIRLKEKFYQQARVVYFLHSIPVLGTILSGDLRVSWDKITEEAAAMPDADIVAGVGPLLCRAALGLSIWGSLATGKRLPCVYECIPGTVVTKRIELPDKTPDTLKLLLTGRASDSIKGLGDMIPVILLLRKKFLEGTIKYRVHLTVRGVPATVEETRDGIKTTVDFPKRAQEWADYMQIGNRVDDEYLNEIREYAENYRRALDEEQTILPGEPPLKLGKVPLPEEPSWITIKPLTPSQDELAQDKADAHAIIMPSYFEHFGLVPGEGAGFGLPVLVNEFSGAGEFFAGERMNFLGGKCVVKDAASLNDRVRLWAEAIEALAADYPERVAAAAQIHELLSGQYTWPDAARALVATATRSSLDWQPKLRFVKQVAGGNTELVAG